MDELRLLERIKSSAIEASIATTFNAYFPFYEEVVLRRLIASGSRLNTLMMDHAQLSQSMASAELRPRLAGFDYALIPVRAGRAFHPKVLIAAGAKRALVTVGSNNITLAGYGHNREVTTVVDVVGKADAEGVAFARAAWSFVECWTEAQVSWLPSPVIESGRRMRELIPWLSGTVANGGAIEFLGTRPDGPNLWQQLKPRIAGNVSRANLVGPFFDFSLELLSTILQELGSPDVTVGIDPKTTEIRVASAFKSSARFVDAHSLGDRTSYLHAKIAYFERSGADPILVLGSANPSSPAWLGSPGARNAEAVVVHVGPRAAEIAQQLGIDRLQDLPEIDSLGWDQIRDRATAETQSERKAAAPAYAIEDGDGFVLNDSRLSQLVVSEVVLQNGSGQGIAGTPGFEQRSDTLHIACSREDQHATRFLEISASDGIAVLAIVHHTRELQSRSHTPRQAQLRTALASLGGSQPDLENLIKVVEQIIFDEDGTRDALKNASGRPGQAGTGGEEDREITSLVGSIEESRIGRRHRRRLVQGGDLGALLDFLIYHLGIDLSRRVEGVDAKGRNEEEITGSDDDDDLQPIVGPNLVDSCQRKVKHLVGRMLRQMKEHGEDEEQHVALIAKLAAVLALLRELRVAERRADWIRPGETLVPIEERRRLLEGVLSFLYSDSRHLLEDILARLNEDQVDEISRVGGLLLWLAWDGGIRGEEIPGVTEELTERRPKLIDRARILTLCLHVGKDELGVEEARTSLARVATDSQRANASGWLDRSLDRGLILRSAMQVPDPQPSRASDIRIGDLVLTKVSSMPKVVTNVVTKRNDKTKKDDVFVWLSGLADEAGDRKFLAKTVRVLLGAA